MSLVVPIVLAVVGVVSVYAAAVATVPLVVESSVSQGGDASLHGLNMDDNRIRGVAAPESPSDAANLETVEAAVAAKAHNTLLGLQGGTGAEMYHLTAAEVAAVQSLDQSVAAGATVSFAAVTDLAAPVNPGDAVNKQTLDAALGGAAIVSSWLTPVISVWPGLTAPVAPVVGDRYIAILNWADAGGNAPSDLAEWDGLAWVFTVPSDGNAVLNKDTEQILTFTGAAWVSVSHNGLSDLQGGIGGVSPERYHLTQSAHDNLSSQDQEVRITSTPTFSAISVTNVDTAAPLAAVNVATMDAALGAISWNRAVRNVLPTSRLAGWMAVRLWSPRMRPSCRRPTTRPTLVRRSCGTGTFSRRTRTRTLCM